jgi:hypothetical protein
MIVSFRHRSIETLSPHDIVTLIRNDDFDRGAAMDTEGRRSQDIVSQLPHSLHVLLTLERFNLHNVELFQNTSADPSFDTRYFAQNCDPFRLPCFWVARKFLYTCGHQRDSAQELALSIGSGCSEELLFAVHPTSLGLYADFLRRARARDAFAEGPTLWALPTSSTRTLLVWPDECPDLALFIKTSLQSPVLGDRRLYRKTVERSVGLAALVRNSEDLPDALLHFPEPMGFVPRGSPDCGVIVRSVPPQIKNGSAIAAPLFSLMGSSDAHPPLLLRIVERSEMSPLEFVDRVICAPFTKLWLELTMRRGLMLEAHGQDLMLELLPDLTPTCRFFYRDFEGLQVDWELRQARGLPIPDLPSGCGWHETYAGWGYAPSQLVWYKIYISLFDFLHFVLNELNIQLRRWQQCGLIQGPQVEEDALTMIFSRHMLSELERSYGFHIRESYNIYRCLTRFIVLLMNVRKRVLRGVPQ